MQNIRQHLNNVFYSKQLYWLNNFLIFLNFLLIASISFDPSLRNSLVYFLVKLIFIFYLVETVVRFFIKGKEYFTNLENMYTAFVLILAIILERPEVTILFTFRLIKFMRALNLIPQTRNLIDALLHVLPGLINLLILISACYAVFGILGQQFFGPKVPDLFGTVGQTLITLSQIMVTDNWGDILNATIPAYPYSVLYFISFLITVTFLLLNAVVGVIVNAIQFTYTKSSENDTK